MYGLSGMVWDAGGDPMVSIAVLESDIPSISSSELSSCRFDFTLFLYFGKKKYHRLFSSVEFQSGK
jgi:hypothetical protein